MIRGGRSRDIGEVVITQRELPRISEVSGDVLLGELRTHRGGMAREPRPMAVVGILRRRGGGGWELSAVSSGERPEVVVERMIFLDDEDHVVDRHWRSSCSDRSGERRGGEKGWSWW